MAQLTVYKHMTSFPFIQHVARSRSRSHQDLLNDMIEFVGEQFVTMIAGDRMMITASGSPRRRRLQTGRQFVNVESSVEFKIEIGVRERRRRQLDDASAFRRHHCRRQRNRRRVEIGPVESQIEVARQVRDAAADSRRRPPARHRSSSTAPHRRRVKVQHRRERDDGQIVVDDGGRRREQLAATRRDAAHAVRGRATRSRRRRRRRRRRLGQQRQERSRRGRVVQLMTETFRVDPVERAREQVVGGQRGEYVDVVDVLPDVDLRSNE